MIFFYPSSFFNNLSNVSLLSNTPPLNVFLPTKIHPSVSLGKLP
nr:MAG TPA: hypothetical protein [Caudoviricetes sp.]